MDVTTLAWAVASFVVGLVGQAIIDYRLGKRLARKFTVPLMRSEASTLLDEKLSPITARKGAMKHGMDPQEMAAERWSRKAEKEARRAETRSAIFAFLTERFGENARAVWAWIPEDILESAIDAGEEWGHILGPILKGATKFENRTITTAAATATPSYQDPSLGA